MPFSGCAVRVTRLAAGLMFIARHVAPVATMIATAAMVHGSARFHAGTAGATIVIPDDVGAIIVLPDFPVMI